MRKRSIALGLVGALALAGAATLASLDKETRGILMYLPTNADVLTWSQTQRNAAFRALDRLQFLAKAREIAPSANPLPLPPGKPLTIPGLDDYFKSQNASAMVILQDGKLRLERYALDFDAQGRWTSFSVAKSYTSTLVGAAILDGSIKSLEDKVSRYVTGLQGSAYDDVTVRQLLTMSSCVQWNEANEDANSGRSKCKKAKGQPGRGVAVSYIRDLPRAYPPRATPSTNEWSRMSRRLSRGAVTVAVVATWVETPSRGCWEKHVCPPTES